jgi:glycosyltransferase involved in cell wall biosynthesis
VKPLLRAAGMVLAPDPEIAWYPFAVRRARQILRAVDIGALYSSSSPETDHLVAWKLKRETGLPWIADFRDGWMFETHRAVRNREGLRRRAELRLERAVVGTADSIVTVNELIADDFRSRYPAAAHRVHVIENGFDPDDLGGLTRHRTADGKMRIVYTGRLALSRTDQSLAPLLAALETLVAGDPDIARDIEVHLIGPLSPHERDEIERSRASDLVRIAGPRPRREALQAQLDADVLLLVTGSDAGVSTSKAYEYLATGRPILGLTKSPPAMELVRASTRGTVVDPQNVSAIASSLLHLHARWAEGTLATSPAAPDNRYTRRFLTGRLAALLDRLSGSATHYSGGKETA